MQDKYLVAFDLDKTLLSVNSSRLIVKQARKKGFMTTKDFRQAIFYSIVYKFDLKDANKIVLSMMKWLRNLQEAEVERLISDQVISSLIGHIRPEIEQEIKDHRNNQARIIILSSALPYLCNPIANHLKLDDVVCSQLEVVNGRFTGNAVGKLVFGKQKEIRMRKYCEENGFSPESSWYYGDAFTDRFVLAAVGNPVCVKPEIKLGKIARRKGWKVI